MRHLKITHRLLDRSSRGGEGCGCAVRKRRFEFRELWLGWRGRLPKASRGRATHANIFEAKVSHARLCQTIDGQTGAQARRQHNRRVEIGLSSAVSSHWLAWTRCQKSLTTSSMGPCASSLLVGWRAVRARGRAQRGELEMPRCSLGTGETPCRPHRGEGCALGGTAWWRVMMVEEAARRAGPIGSGSHTAPLQDRSGPGAPNVEGLCSELLLGYELRTRAAAQGSNYLFQKQSERHIAGSAAQSTFTLPSSNPVAYAQD